MEIYIKKALNCFVLLLNRNIIWATHIKSINQQPKPRSNYLQNSRSGIWRGKYNSQEKLCNQCRTKTYFPNIDFRA